MYAFSILSLLIPALLLFAGIYFREAIRHTQMQQITAARVVAYYRQICGTIVDGTRDPFIGDMLNAIDERLVGNIKNLESSFNLPADRKQELQEISTGLSNAATKFESIVDFETHPLLRFAKYFVARYTDMESAEYKEMIETGLLFHKRMIYPSYVLSEKDGAVISESLAFSIAQVRTTLIDILECSITLARFARYHGKERNAPELILRQGHAMLFKCANLVAQNALIYPEAAKMLDGSAFRKTLSYMFIGDAKR